MGSADHGTTLAEFEQAVCSHIKRSWQWPREIGRRARARLSGLGVHSGACQEALELAGWVEALGTSKNLLASERKEMAVLILPPKRVYGHHKAKLDKPRPHHRKFDLQ